MIRSKRDYLPNPEQVLLLRAALLDGNEALEAWNRWSDTVNLDDIDSGSHRLLPLLYKNLKDLEVDGSKLGRIKGVYKHTWMRNQLVFLDIEPVIIALHDAGIEIMLLKDMALSIHIYDDFGMGPMVDNGILVPRADTQEAIEILCALGWNPEFNYVRGDLPIAHAAHFASQEGNSLDLHGQMMYTDTERDFENGYWERAVDTNFGDIPVKVLCPTDQLIHACVHGVRWNLHPLIRWIADSYSILQIGEIEWDHLVAHAQQLQVTKQLSSALCYLKAEFEQKIPDDVLQSLENTPVSRWENWNYQLSIREPLPIFGGFILQFICYWTYHRKKYPFPGLLRFMQFRWGLRYLWQVPFEGVLRGLHRIKNCILKIIPVSFSEQSIFHKK